jgi:hypothetical protein
MLDEGVPEDDALGLAQVVQKVERDWRTGLVIPEASKNPRTILARLERTRPERSALREGRKWFTRSKESEQDNAKTNVKVEDLPQNKFN